MAEASRTSSTRKKARPDSSRKGRGEREEVRRVDDAAPAAVSAVEPARDDDSERVLARTFAYGVPVVGALGALVVGLTAGLAPGILVLAGTALLGTIGFFWASLRTLSGDAPLPEGVSMHALVSRTPAPERKRETLRALKDLELEHSIGKIDDADYLELSTRYRTVAKNLMREMDEGLAPRRDRAEALVKAHLAKKKIAAPEVVAEDADGLEKEPAPEATPAPARLECTKCSVSNEPDAAFCKKCGTPLAQPENTTEDKADASV